MARKKKARGNKYADVAQPQATLDYHGQGILTADEIQEMARDFLEACSQKGLSSVLIITGKGLHSASGPVIGPLLRQYLPTLSVVDSVMTARRDRGGEGALEVKLS